MRILGFALPALMLAAAPALACSPGPDYAVPTTLELAESADTILVGTVTGEGPDVGPMGTVQLRPTLLLKGAALPAEIGIPGRLERPDFRMTPSDPDELREPNPDALMGACVRYIYAKGTKLLVFFVREKGVLQFAFYPFARVSENVASDDARWVKAVRVYAEVAALPEAQRRTALIAHRDALRAQTGDADARAIADDIDIELTIPRPPVR